MNQVLMTLHGTGLNATLVLYGVARSRSEIYNVCSCYF